MAENIEEFYKEYDERENIEFTPQNNERISLPCIWVSEIFPPSQISNFYMKAKELGWEDDCISLNSDFTDQVAKMRVNGLCGWLNLGIIYNKDNNSVFRERVAELPQYVKYVHCCIIQPFPSATIAVFQFIFDEYVSDIVNEVLYERIKSDVEVYGTRIVNRGVFWKKKLRIKTEREYIKSLCTEWVANTFPGVFANVFARKYPTVDILLFQEYRPCLKKDNKQEYIRLFDLGDRFESWQCSKLEKLYLNKKYYDEPDGYNLTLYCNINDLNDKDEFKHYCGDVKDKLTSYLVDFSNNVALYAMFYCVKMIQNAYFELRDMVNQLFIEDEPELKQIYTMYSKMNELQLTFIVFLKDYLHYFKNKNAFIFRDIFHFSRTITFTRKVYKDFLIERDSEVMNGIASEAMKLDKEMNVILDRSISLANAIYNNKASRVNIKIQKSMLLLTVALLLFSVVVGLKDYNIPQLVKTFISNLLQ